MPCGHWGHRLCASHVSSNVSQQMASRSSCKGGRSGGRALSGPGVSSPRVARSVRASARAFQPVPASTWATSPGKSKNPGTSQASVAAAAAPMRGPQMSQVQLLEKQVHASFDSLNRRDLVSLAQCLTMDVQYEHTSESTVFSGRDGVLVWFRHLMSQVPDEAGLRVDAVSISSGSCEATVTWHVEVNGLSVPWSKGTSTYTFGQANRISRIRDSVELPLGLALPALSLTSPAVGVATPLLKSLQEAISFSGVASLLGPMLGDGTSSSGGRLSTFTDRDEPFALPSISFPAFPSFPFPSGWVDSSRPSSSSSEANVSSSSADSLSNQRSGSNDTGNSSSSSSSSGSSSSSSSSSRAFGSEGKNSTKEIRMRVLPLPDIPDDSSSSSSSSISSSTFRVSASDAAAGGTGGPVGSRAGRNAGGASAPSRLGSEPRSSQGTSSPAAPGYEAASRSPQPPTSTPAQADLSGVWSKDLAASDEQAYETMLDVLGLSGLQRVTARLIEGMKIRHVPGKSFDVSYLTVVPFFKVTESSLIGYQRSMMRRDLRPGSQRTVAEEVLGGVRVSMDWGAPNAGALQEVYMLEGDSMSVLCNVAVGGRKATAVLMYKRMHGGADDLLRESRQRNSSFDTVLARQQERYGWK